MLYNDDPPRSALIEQIRLAEKLGAENGSPQLIPSNVNDRILMFGLLNEVAGESGLIYTWRLMGKDTDPDSQASVMLAEKYGYTPEAAAAGEQHLIDILQALSAQLRMQKVNGSKYFVGDSISVLDIYWATFSIAFGLPDEEIMPRTRQNMGQFASFKSFGAKMPAVMAAVDPMLLEHREFIYRNHLQIPAAIGGSPRR